MMKQLSKGVAMNKEFYAKKNKQTAISIYGDRLDENRKVIGTNIWFDYYWRIHISKIKGN